MHGGGGRPGQGQAHDFAAADLAGRLDARVVGPQLLGRHDARVGAEQRCHRAHARRHRLLHKLTALPHGPHLALAQGIAQMLGAFAPAGGLHQGRLACRDRARGGDLEAHRLEAEAGIEGRAEAVEAQGEQASDLGRAAGRQAQAEVEAAQDPIDAGQGQPYGPGAEAGLDMGGYISFSGILTFNRSEDIRAVAAASPMDRILVETDAPFLAPPPFRGKRNEPAYTRYTAEVLAKVKGLTLDEVAAATSDNFFRLFAKTPDPRAAEAA